MQIQFVIIAETKGSSRSYGKYHAWGSAEVHSFHCSKEEATKELETLSPKKQKENPSKDESWAEETTYRVVSTQELSAMLPRYEA